MPPLEAPHGPAKKKVRKAPSLRPETAGNPNVAKPRVVRAKPQPAPTPTQIRSSRAQERGYKSQGKAVRKIAGQQQAVARAKSQENAYRSQGQQVEKSANRQRVVRQLTREFGRDYAEKNADAFMHLSGPKVDLRKTRHEQAARLAPVLSALEQTTRPLHAIANTTKAAIEGNHDLKGAFVRGIQNKDKTTFSDVLKAAHAPGIVQKVGGFAADVALDPTTYVTGGTGSVARKTAVDAAESVTKKALAKGLTKEQAKAFGERAAKAAAKKAPEGKGLIIRVGRHEVPGVRRATEKAARPVKKVARRATSEKARSTARSIAADVNPNVAPAGVAKQTSRRAIQATRTARATSNVGHRHAVNLAHGIKTQIGEQNYNAVVDAIEAGRIRDLPENLRPHAIRLRSQSKYIRRLQRRAGVKVADVTKGGQVKGYVVRKLTEEAKVAEGKGGRSGVGTRVIKPASSKVRKEKRPLRIVRQESPGKYREDLHALMAERHAEGATSAAKATLNRDLADLGRPVKRGQELRPAEGEAVFHIKGSDIREVTDPKELARITRSLRVSKDGTKLKGANKVGGRFVVLNKDLVKRSLEGAAPTLQGLGIVHTIDKATVGFKRLAIATPGFHVRNFAGDMQNAYLGQPTYRLPGNMRRAARILKAHGASERAMRELKPGDVGHAILETKRYGDVTYDQAARELARHGAFRSGYTAGELRELSASGGVSTGRIATTIRKAREKVGETQIARTAKAAALNREDLPRLTTAMEALRRGATWQQAAQAVADLHFDYQHLTNFERQIARRAAPFYTWSARNIPLQARKFLTNPGKYANYEKLREEFTKASGVDRQDKQVRDLYAQLKRAGVKLAPGWERYLSSWEQRNAGIPISWKGHKFTISLGLPLQDLNEAPGAATVHQLNEWYQKGMSLTGPIPKDAIEYFENHSFFFRDQLERDTSPLVAAPGYVAAFPAALQKKLGVTKMIDKRSGLKVWAWPGKMDYLAKAVPGTPNYAQQLLTGTDRRSKGIGGKLLAYGGIKSVPVDPIANAVNLAYERMTEIQKQLAGLRQQGIGKDRPSQEWARLNAQLKIVTQIAYAGKAAQGYKVLPTHGGPSVGTSSGHFDFSGGGSGFDFSGG